MYIDLPNPRPLSNNVDLENVWYKKKEPENQNVQPQNSMNQMMQQASYAQQPQMMQQQMPQQQVVQQPQQMQQQQVLNRQQAAVQNFAQQANDSTIMSTVNPQQKMSLPQRTPTMPQ